jgi:hypothetical protein
MMGKVFTPEVRKPSEPPFGLLEQLGTAAIVVGMGLVVGHEEVTGIITAGAGLGSIALGKVSARLIKYN